MKKLHIYYHHIITLMITTALLICSGLFFGEAYVRIAEAFRDLGLSLAGLFCRLFGIEFTFNDGALNGVSSILNLGYIVDVESIKNKFISFGNTFISCNNFVGYLNHIFNSAYSAFYIIMIVILGSPLVIIPLIISFAGHNNAIGEESKTLKTYKQIEKIAIIPFKRIIVNYFNFLDDNRIIKRLWLVIVIISLNVVTIVIELAANIFYVLSTFSFSGFFIQLQKLLADLSLLTRVPLIIWFFIGIIVFLKMRTTIAISRLFSREAHNGAFCKSLNIVGIISAIMGAGKTRFLTDLLLTKQKQMRAQALEIMLEIDFIFPEFPWRKLENKIRNLMERHTIYNISSCEQYANNWKIVIDNCLSSEVARKYYAKGLKSGRISEPFLLGYEWGQYGFKKNNGLKIEWLSDVIGEYMKAYFIYSSPTSMIFSNYAISVRGRKLDNGNLPMWVWNFFGEVVDLEERQNSHIADFDMFRLGKRQKKNNDQANAFEYGIVGISEGDKERGNQFDTNELKKLAEEANQKNDNFNGFYKMSRQVTNIRGRGFFFSLLDMQRLASINLDMREIGDSITISETSDNKMLVPFFALDELIYEILVPWFTDKYKDFSFRRGDTTLGLYLLKKIVSAVSRYHKKMYNQYSCIEQKVIVNEQKESKYFIMPKKIHSDVYSTDIMASFFRKKASYSKKGINDIPTFKGVRATFKELGQMNSYMVDNWINSLAEYEREDCARSCNGSVKD